MKSFLGGSEIHSLENAVGQYIVYRDVMAKTEPNRTLYLAITKEAFDGIFSEPIGQFIIENNNLNTEYGIANELVDEGIPKQQIVLGFRSPEVCKHREFALN